MAWRARSLVTVTALCALLPASGAEAQDRRRYCRDFASDQDVVAYCEEVYGTTLHCGGLDRDRDGLPCECTVGGPDADKPVCGRWRKRAEDRNLTEAGDQAQAGR